MGVEFASVDTSRTDCDMVLVGGGLANSLIALSVRATRPDARVVMLERAAMADATHTWCVFRSDLTARSWSLLAPLFANLWQGYDVMFPAHARRLSTPYARLRSQDLANATEAALGEHLVRGADAVEVTPTRVTLADGRKFTAPLVIDGRGPRVSPHLRVAYQKFVGLEVALAAPHGVEVPIMIDATVAQIDGYRFVYVLPLGVDRLLIEDTRYSDGLALDIPALEAACRRYAVVHGWTVEAVERVESGVLPVVLSGDIRAFWADAGDVPTVGLRGAFFHPTTGYSLPEAALVAEAIADLATPTSAATAKLLHKRSLALWKDGRFYHLINRMMFWAATPDMRYRVLERFYRLSPTLIERFYARRLTLADRLRILTGKPPVPMGPAIRAAVSGVPQHA